MVIVNMCRNVVGIMNRSPRATVQAMRATSFVLFTFVLSLLDCATLYFFPVLVLILSDMRFVYLLLFSVVIPLVRVSFCAYAFCIRRRCCVPKRH